MKAIVRLAGHSWSVWLQTAGSKVCSFGQWASATSAAPPVSLPVSTPLQIVNRCWPGFPCKWWYINVETFNQASDDFWGQQNCSPLRALIMHAMLLPNSRIWCVISIAISEYLLLHYYCRKHMRRHSGEHPYSCGMCSMKFIYEFCLYDIANLP